MSTIFSKLFSKLLPPSTSLPFLHKAALTPPTPKPWPEYPFRLIHHTTPPSTNISAPTLSSHHTALLMAQTHNSIFRALNAIHAQSRSVAPNTQDAVDLLAYTHCTYIFIHTHHTAEEAAFFPAIELAAGKPGLMQENVVQHRALEDGLERLRRYATETRKEDFDGEVLRAVVEDLVEVLEMHLHEEIGSIVALEDIISLEALEAAYDALHHKAAQSDVWKNGPFVFGTQDDTFAIDGERTTFPAVSSIVPYLIAYIVSRRHAGAWRFSPSSAFGQLRPCTGQPLPQHSICQELLWVFCGLVVVLIAVAVGAYGREISGGF